MCSSLVPPCIASWNVVISLNCRGDGAGGWAESTAAAVTHAGASLSTQLMVLSHTVLSCTNVIQKACWGEQTVAGVGRRDYKAKVGKAGDTTASAGGSAQETLPRQDLACRLQVMGWHLLSSISTGSSNWGDKHGSRKALWGAQPALGPPRKAAGASCCLCCFPALQAGAELCLEERGRKTSWELDFKGKSQVQSGCNVNRNLLFAAH